MATWHDYKKHVRETDPVADQVSPDINPAVHLAETPDGLSLCGGDLTLRLDFRDMLSRVRPDRWEHELLVRAARIHEKKDLTAIDATAGLGEDSLILAAAGFHVQMYEQDPVIAALLEDAMQRAAADPVLAPLIARMHLTEGDSIQALHGLARTSYGQASDIAASGTSDRASALENSSPAGPDPAAAGTAQPGSASLPAAGTGQSRPASAASAGGPAAPGQLPVIPDVIYLDPMFPERRKSGLVGKKFQLLHHLEAPACNEEELLGAALAVRPHKVVIKRPLKGPFLAGRKPDYSIRGKAIRYDCFVLSH